jgi:hypothetical protein
MAARDEPINHEKRIDEANAALRNMIVVNTRALTDGCRADVDAALSSLDRVRNMEMSDEVQGYFRHTRALLRDAIDKLDDLASTTPRLKRVDVAEMHERVGRAVGLKRPRDEGAVVGHVLAGGAPDDDAEEVAPGAEPDAAEAVDPGVVPGVAPDAGEAGVVPGAAPDAAEAVDPGVVPGAAPDAAEVNLPIVVPDDAEVIVVVDDDE